MVETLLSNESSDTLSAALARHQLELTDEQILWLDRYCHSLWGWNEKLNLTRHTDYEKFVARDVVDCCQLEPFLEPGERVLDFGTGGGVPGVVLSILRPDLSLELCDSVAKKAKAVGEIVSEIGLSLPVHHRPVQELLAENSYHTLVARAVAPLAKILRWLEPHWESFDRLLVIKGPAWVEERQAAHHEGLFRGLQLRKVASYPLAGTDSESVVLSVRPKE